MINTPLPADALSLARARRRAAQNVTHRRCGVRTLRELDLLETTSHMHTEKGEKSNVMRVLIDEHVASSGRSLSIQARARRRAAQNVSLIF